MGNLLNNNVAPLWVWIVVIAVGSALLIGIVTAVILCCIRRRRNRSKKDLESGGLTRRVTLKNGRLVEQTNHVSLTGSNFGLMSDYNPERSTSPTIQRGSSPFDWWAGIKERSASRQSNRSQDTASVLDRPASAANDMYRAIDTSPPRLSLTSLNEKNIARSTTSLSDVSNVSTISKPLIAMTAESRRARAVNFSRPQPRRTPTNTSRHRLSIINETTPRNSFLSMSSLRARIVSWASTPIDYDQNEIARAERSMEAEKRNETDHRHSQISEKAPILTLNFEPTSDRSGVTRVASPQELPATSEIRSRTPSPVDFTLQELTGFLDAPTPELPSRHPSRRSMHTNMSEPQTRAARSRSNSANNFSRKPMLTQAAHSRTNSATNFSRKPPFTGDVSRSSSINRSSYTNNFSRPANNINDSSRTDSNISWFEAPIAEATLSEPFDMPGSRTSVWSSETKEMNSEHHLQHQLLQTSLAIAQVSEDTSPPNSNHATIKSEPLSEIHQQQHNIVPPLPHQSNNDDDTTTIIIYHELDLNNNEDRNRDRQQHLHSQSQSQHQPPPPSPSGQPAMTTTTNPQRHSRGRSPSTSRDIKRQRSTSRGPIRARSVSKGRNVLRKRSLHRPEAGNAAGVEIKIIGPADLGSSEGVRDDGRE